MSFDATTIAEHGLTPEEFQSICQILGRDPSYVELGIFSVMWSEHCSYKSSRVHLKKFPTKGKQVICGPGENAGVVDLGDGLCAIFKMESHNHPSFIEPYQGAATGVGGILRDIFTMGARPIALLNSLRFGDFKKSKTKSLVHGVVAGIAGYGNCMGIPTVGGECSFDPSFNGNNLVNAFCIGIAPKKKIFRAQARGLGNPVIYLGAKTGRDGIHGATMASAEFDEASEEKRPTVQVGDPFTEKRLLEACLELMAGGDIVAIQDMGAAGLTCSSLEMAGKGNVGIDLNLDKVPCREEKMTPYEMMLSESQERMLLVAKQGAERRVRKIFEKWDLDAAVVGKVVKGDQVTVRFQNKVVAQLPTQPITEQAPLYRRPCKPSPALKKLQSLDVDSLPEPKSWEVVLHKMLAHPNHASKHWIYQQYDHMVGTDTVILPGSDAAVLRLKGTGRKKKGDKGIAMTTDCNGRYCFLDPHRGAMHAVAEAARNITCSGATPLAITDCLNFGNPENPAIMWQFEQAVRGISEACRALGTPVVSGNVSFYNETEGKGIDPTPTIGMIGLLDDVDQHCRQWFQEEGDAIVLLGWNQPTLGASSYLQIIHRKKQGRPPVISLAREKKVQGVCRQLIQKGWVRSAHDVSEGGVAMALAEACLGPAGQEQGAEITLSGRGHPGQRLFGESAARILLSVPPERLQSLLRWARQRNCPAQRIGKVGGKRLKIGDLLDVSVAAAAEWWHEGFERGAV